MSRSRSIFTLTLVAILAAGVVLAVCSTHAMNSDDWETWSDGALHMMDDDLDSFLESDVAAGDLAFANNDDDDSDDDDSDDDDSDDDDSDDDDSDDDDSDDDDSDDDDSDDADMHFMERMEAPANKQDDSATMNPPNTEVREAHHFDHDFGNPNADGSETQEAQGFSHDLPQLPERPSQPEKSTSFKGTVCFGMHCPHDNAACCLDKEHCCPHGYKCCEQQQAKNGGPCCQKLQPGESDRSELVLRPQIIVSKNSKGETVVEAHLGNQTVSSVVDLPPAKN
jgi:Granulin